MKFILLPSIFGDHGAAVKLGSGIRPFASAQWYGNLKIRILRSIPNQCALYKLGRYSIKNKFKHMLH